MGSHLWANIAAWTFFCFIQVLSADRSLFQDLGLTTHPDVTKINISQDEYTRMMSTYLNVRQHSSDANTIPKLITFDLEPKSWWSNLIRDNGRLKFSIRPNNEIEIEDAQLRLLLPSRADYESTEVRVKVYQTLGTNRRRFIEEKVLYLSHELTKWCEFDVTSAVIEWLNGAKNLGLELVCDNCINSFYPNEAAISALFYPTNGRYRRSSSPYQSHRRTDCREPKRGNTKKRCCRHNMTVKFSELRFPEMGSIYYPKVYEAGFCQGQCPPNYNHATNHSRIQSLLHQMDRKNAKHLNRRAIPKACCAPSKLEPLDILRADPTNESKLIVEKWDNMQVIECACS